VAAAEPSPLRTFRHADFTPEALLEAKAVTGLTTAVVLPARNEEATVASVVAAFEPLRAGGVLDEVVVVDSLSVDRTAAVAEAAGARVVAVGDEVPGIPPLPGKGEAMWRGLHGTTADLVAFCDADVLDAGPHYALGLLGPLLLHPQLQLVKGFYRRPIVALDGTVEEHGGRVTELTARPFLNLYRPDLAHFVQPLAGEWSGRREHLESLAFPIGYGVEIAVLLDTHEACGLDGMAQCDLGTRTHRHQSQQALGVMAAQVLAAAIRRLGVEPAGTLVRQFGVDDHRELDTGLVLDERPPVASLRSDR
jgi:glucosyl-3-phosphoglycerate synthase